ncbi:MAG: hypothetical protein ABH865_03225 [Candidatus Omnitrophota bacterium]
MRGLKAFGHQYQKGIRLFSIAVVFIVVTVSFSVADAQENSNTPSFLPGKNSDDSFQRKIAFAKDVLQKAGYLEILEVYRAVREEDTSRCASPQAVTLANDLLALRYAGENRCGSIKNVLFRQMCEAANADSCDAAGPLKNFCSGVRASDPVRLMRELSGGEFLKALGVQLPITENTVLFGLSIYYGFKHYSPVACERFLNDARLPLSSKVSCQLLFAQDFNSQYDSLVNDLALFMVSRLAPQEGACEQIQNGRVKKACLNKAIKDLGDIW